MIRNESNEEKPGGLRARARHAARAIVHGLALAAMVAIAPGASAERIKDLASIQGVRGNPLIGYGLVVGLDGSGDQTTQTPFTVQSVLNMLTQMGVNLPPGTNLQLKNVAAVMVTGSLPPFAKPGQAIDVTVSSMGNAKSLRGGTLLMTPLKGADGQVYAIGQGNVLVGGVGAEGGGSKVTVNHVSVGRIPSGALVERAVPSNIGDAEHVYIELNLTDFSTTQRVVDAINGIFPEAASALDGRVVRVRAPGDVSGRVGFLAKLESLEITPAAAMAKVIVNSRTGSVVLNRSVQIDACAIAHGNLSVVISTEPLVSQPNEFSRGRTVQAERSQIEIKAQSGSLIMLKGAALAEVVKALNAIGATPQDMLAILQAMKAAGALRADLEVI
jgi:flagellar P-ring protein precursor FlgI